MADRNVAEGSERRVLITGATGFAGSSLVERYLAAGWQVHGTYRDPIEDEALRTSGAMLYLLDLRDTRQVRDLMSQVRPHVVQHLAAQSSTRLSWDDPLATINENAAMQLAMLEAVTTESPTATVVIAGSCDEYGDVAPDENPVDESQELRPISPYAISKVVQDLMGYQYFVTRSIRVIRLRPFLQLGPRRQAGFVAGSFARQVAAIAAGLQDPVIEVGNLDLRRDFVDVRDVAAAYMVSAEACVAGQVYNVATGVGHSLREMLTLMLARADVQARIVPVDHLIRTGEPPVLIGNAGRLHEASGWMPTISFEQSVADTLDHWRSRVGGAELLKGGRG